MQNQSSMTKPSQLNTEKESKNKVLLLSCSRNGYELMNELATKLTDWEIIKKVHCSSLGELSEAGKLSDTVAQYYDQVDAIIFICAAGIAVRSIAALVDSKKKDPAVLVIDEAGKNCISLLSGHYGGANALAAKFAKLINANPVITTATDCEGLFSIDEFAGKNQMSISDWNLMKDYAVSVLEGKAVGLQRDSWVSLDKAWPYEEEESERKVIISEKKQITNPYLQLIPRCIVIGIGCRKDTSYELIRSAVSQAIEMNGLCTDAICALASIDLKQEEAGILAMAEELKVPFVCFTPEQLRAVEGDFEASEFVEKTTGVDNVCEKSAVCYASKHAMQYTTIMKKTIYENVTIAMVRIENTFTL